MDENQLDAPTESGDNPNESGAKRKDPCRITPTTRLLLLLVVAMLCMSPDSSPQLCGIAQQTANSII